MPLTNAQECNAQQKSENMQFTSTELDGTSRSLTHPYKAELSLAGFILLIAWQRFMAAV
jgi:hypothetical protein